MSNAIIPQTLRRLTLALSCLLAALGFAVSLLTAAPARAQAGVEDKALGRPATASSVEASDNGFGCGGDKCTPGKANDGSASTRWSSAFADNQFWTVDLGGPRSVDSVAITWEVAYARRFSIGVSSDGLTFKTVAEAEIDTDQKQLERTKRFDVRVSFSAQSARYVRITGLTRVNAKWPISFWNVSVFGPPDVVLPTPVPAPADPASPQVSPFTSIGPTTPPSAAPPPAPAPTNGVKSPPARLTPFPVVRIVGVATTTGASIRRFTVRAPRSAQVRVTCNGGGCPARTLRRRGPGRVRGIQRRLRVGAVVRVFVTQKNRVGKYTRFTIRKGQAPGRFDSCAMHGAKRPTPCSAS